MARRLFLIGIMVVIEPGKMTQIAIGTIFSAAFLVVQLIAQPFKKGSDDLLGVSCSFALLMFFVCSVLYKIDALTSIDDLQAKMSLEQKRIYALSPLTLSYILIGSVLMSIIAMALIVSGQIALEARRRMKLRRIKYLKTGKEVELTPLEDAQAFHLFLSHAWPAAQDRMRIVKERFTEAMPSARVFLDVDNLKSGSGTAEVDKSECILVFCTKAYFEKKNSMKELYRAVVQKRPILAMLEPDVTQDGGLDEPVIRAMLGSEDLDGVKFSWLQGKWKEWRDEGALAPGAFDHAPSGREVAAALFTVAPVEWNRLPHFQDVTIRLIAERGILHGTGGSLYLQGEMASVKVPIAPSVPSTCARHTISGARDLRMSSKRVIFLAKRRGSLGQTMRRCARSSRMLCCWTAALGPVA